MSDKSNSKTIKKRIKKYSTPIALSIGAIIFYLSYAYFDTIINASIKSNFWRFDQNPLVSDIIFFIIGLCSLTYLFYKVIKNLNEKINIQALISLVILLFVYILTRQQLFPKQEWKYISFTNEYLDYIKYSDAIALTIVPFLLDYSIKLKKVDKSNPSVFITDSSSNGLKSDLFKRKVLVERLVQEILSLKNPENAFAIGVNGQWGTGKTVFLKQIGELLEDKAITIEFNPWRSESPEHMTNDFFTQFKEAIKQYDTDTSNDIGQYAKTLTQGNENALLKSINSFLQIFREEESLSSQFNYLSKKLKYFPNKIVVFIDDLDRLNPQEILEVLKIIRNTANFSNTVFIVAYDYQYVVSAIKKGGMENEKQYLEKIFQMDIALPAYPNHVVFDYCLTEMLLNKSDNDKKTIKIAMDKVSNFPIDFSIDENKHITRNLFGSYINTIRDAVRFVNSFNLFFESKKKNVELSEFILIEMIRLKYPFVYNSIVKQFTVLDNLTFFTQITVKGSSSRYFTFINDKFNLPELEKDTRECSLVIETLKFLFRIQPEGITSKSISLPRNTLTYFSEGLFDNIKHEDFLEAAQKTDREFANQVKTWLKAEYKNELADILLWSKYFESADHFKKHLIGLCMLENDFILSEVYDRIILIKQNTASYFDNQKSKYRDFLLSFLSDQEHYLQGACTLIIRLLKDIVYEKLSEVTELLKKEDLQKLLNQNLKYLIDSGKSVNDELLWSCYINNIENIDASRRFVIDQTANTILREHIILRPNEYVEKLIEKYKPASFDFYNIEVFARQIFVGWENFEKFLFGLDENDLKVNEAMALYRRYKVNNYLPIEFKRGTYEFISDKKTMFLGSESFPNIPRNTPTVEFIHPDQMYIVGTKDGSLFSEYKFVAHANPITDEEAQRGGKYELERRFYLKLPLTSVKKASIRFNVVKQCVIQVNSTYLNNSNPFYTRKVNTKSYEEPYIETKDITSHLNEGENIIKFLIENKSNSHLNNTDLVKIQGVDNPYGIIYTIIIET